MKMALNGREGSDNSGIVNGASKLSSWSAGVSTANYTQDKWDLLP